MGAGQDVDRVDGDDLDDLRERTVAFVRAFGLHRPETTPCGQPLTVSEAYALMELARDSSMSQKALASRLNLDKSTVSRLVNALEPKGWVERGRDGADGRISLLVLTSSGRRASRRVDEARAARFDGMLGRIPLGERAAVLRALAVLAEAAGDDARQPSSQLGAAVIAQASNGHRLNERDDGSADSLLAP